MEPRSGAPQVHSGMGWWYGFSPGEGGGREGGLVTLKWGHMERISLCGCSPKDAACHGVCPYGVVSLRRDGWTVCKKGTHCPSTMQFCIWALSWCWKAPGTNFFHQKGMSSPPLSCLTSIPVTIAYFLPEQKVTWIHLEAVLHYRNNQNLIWCSQGSKKMLSRGTSKLDSCTWKCSWNA